MKIHYNLLGVASALFLAGEAAAAHGTRNMIVNGDPVAEAYPFYGFFEVGCGVSIVAPDMVLTAAHCDSWDKLSRRVWLGSTELQNGTERHVVERIPHPEYRTDLNSTGSYDIMLMRVNTNLLVDADGNPTNLTTVTINGDGAIPEPSQELLVIGHGLSSVDSWDLEEKLLEVPLFAYDNQVCYDIYNQTADPYSSLTVIPESMFCAGQGPKGFGGSCNGDSGGPIIDPTTGVQIGIVSWGHACSLYGYPSVFGRISSAFDWINQQICEHSCFPDKDLCPEDTKFHPCADPGDEPEFDSSFLSSGSIGMNLTIVSDSWPEEIAFVLEHVESGMEVDFQPYGTFTPDDAALLDYNESLVIEHTFENLPSGLYHLTVGDAAGDGIWAFEEGDIPITLSFLDSGEEIWTDDGLYGYSTETYIKFDEEGQVEFVSRFEDGITPPSAAPTPYPAFDDGYPGRFPEDPLEVMINVQYDYFVPETSWYFQQRVLLDSESAENVAVQRVDPSQREWKTLQRGPQGLEGAFSIYSYNVSNLLPNSLYRFVFLDSFGDGIYSWGATITDSNPSDDYVNGTLLWSLPNDFLTMAGAYFWIDEERNMEVINVVKVPKAPYHLELSCTEAGLVTEVGAVGCEMGCAKADCCWNTTAGDLCSYNPQCAGYSYCSILLGNDDSDAAVMAEEIVDQIVDQAGEILDQVGDVVGGILGKKVRPPY